LTKKSINLQTALAADTHLPEGQWLKEQLNVVKLRMFRVGTRRPTSSRTEGQYLAPQKAFKNNNNNNSNRVVIYARLHQLFKISYIVTCFDSLLTSSRPFYYI
jgi:hypothetical protein